MALLVPKIPFTDPPGFIERHWMGLPKSAQIALVVVAVLLVLVGMVLFLRWMKRLMPRGHVWGFAGLSLTSFAVFVFFVIRLPETRGTIFVLSDQLYRLGAALSGTALVGGLIWLLLPYVLDLVQDRTFVQFVATRHVRRGRSGFLSVISVLSVLGVGISAFALCAVISVMGGFGADLKRKILANNAHILVDFENYGGFEDWEKPLNEVRLVPGVNAATPVVGGEAMASSSNNTAGLLVRGIDTDTIGTVIELLDNIEVGSFDYLKNPIELARLPPDTPIGKGPSGETYLKGPDSAPWLDALDEDVRKAVKPDDVFPGIIVGRELARTLHLYVGDEVTLVSPLGDLGPMGVMPRSVNFRVAAIFYSGMYEYDSSHAYMDIRTAQDFLDLGLNVTSLEIKVDNADQVEKVGAAVEQVLGREDLRVRDWKQLNKNLFSALKLEKIMTFIILLLAIIVSSFCIICTLLLMVTEKSKEIAILKAMGATDTAILRVFMSEGLIIGTIGTVFGVATGFAACFGLKSTGLRLDPNVYYVDRLPISIDPLEYAMIAVAAIGITALATVYPAVAASRLRPVEGIRYE